MSQRLERKVEVWQPPAPEEVLAEATAKRSAGRRSVGEKAPKVAAKDLSLRVMPEHFAQPSLVGALAARRGRVLVAEGDSWFDFPVPTRVDLLDALDKLGRRTVSIAYRGDTLENMVYGTEGVDGRPGGSDLARLVTLIRETDPPAVLLSAGGNDVAGSEFRAFLNHKSSGRPALRERFLKEYIHEYVRDAYRKVVGEIGRVAPRAKIVVHGYANARPSGLGVGRLFGWNLVGPWLKPALDATGYGFAEGAMLVRRVIGEFNDMLAGLAREDRRIVYVDLRPHVGEAIADWSDELHLNNEPVRRAAKVIDAAITRALGE